MTQPEGSESAAVQADPVEGWIRNAQQGDRPAMERLIEHFQDAVWRRARYRLGDPDEAWDVAQDVFVICFRKIKQYRGDAPFWAWLSRIVDNQVRNRWGWQRRRGRDVTFSLSDMRGGEEGEDPLEWDPPDHGPSPARQAMGRESFDALERCMGELSPEHREILLLRFADGMAYEEIAETLRISVGTVKSRINRARHDLREKMGPYL